jgi:hypothetical protein
MTCECCGIRQATRKDYRYIDKYGFQGKCYVCNICSMVNDWTFVEIHRGYGTQEALDELRDVILPEKWEEYGLEEDIDDQE